MFFAMLVIYRFRSAIVAYVAMTLAMLLSLRKVRNKSYEVSATNEKKGWR
jgi:hypothetical protein